MPNVLEMNLDITCLLLFSVAYAIAVSPPNITGPDSLLLPHPQDSYPSINISFIKEITLSVQPQDFDLSPHQEEEVSTFLESGLRLLDPIMRFFDGLVGSWSPARQQNPPPPPQDQRFLSIA